jgi:uncharacterized membrane protein YraQ (UPF0718 family)
MTYAIWAVTALGLLVSLLRSPRRTWKAVVMALRRMGKIAPLFLTVMVAYALVVTYLSRDVIQSTLGAENGLLGAVLALIIGSSALMPGFVAYPLCALLAAEGVPFFVLALFSVALMNVGVATFPLEAKYLGWRVALIRNSIAVVISILIGLAVGVVFGEIVL